MRLIDLAVAAVLAAALRQDLDAPAPALGIARIHAEQVAGEDRRLVAARRGADLEEHIVVVERIGRHQQSLELGSRRRPWLARGRRSPAGRARARRRPGRRPSRAPPSSSRSRPASRSRPRAIGSMRANSMDRSRKRAELPSTAGSESMRSISACRSATRSSRRRMASFMNRPARCGTVARPPRRASRRRPRPPRAAPPTARAAGGS